MKIGKQVFRNGRFRIMFELPAVAVLCGLIVFSEAAWAPAVAESPSPTFTHPLGMVFVYLPPGDFTMGSPPEEAGRGEDETRHAVILTRGFYMQTTEVTQSQWAAVMGKNPARFPGCGGDCPVEGVSWTDVNTFIRRLNKRDGTDRYTLPTEAMWEYAARAGTETAFASGEIVEAFGTDPNLNIMGWYRGNSGVDYTGCMDATKWAGADCAGTHPVKQKKSNAWGLFDMHGNVWEWCRDWYGGDFRAKRRVDPTGPKTGSDRVVRGGAWNYAPAYCRSAARGRFGPGFDNIDLGFRLIRTVSQ